MTTKIEYSTHYDSNNTICGFVMAEDKGEYYTINKAQYNRALSKRTVGGIAGINFHSDKPVYVIGIDIQ